MAGVVEIKCPSCGARIRIDREAKKIEVMIDRKPASFFSALCSECKKEIMKHVR